MLLVSYIQQYFNTSITVLTNRVWKLLIALFKVSNTASAFTVSSIGGVRLLLLAVDYNQAEKEEMWNRRRQRMEKKKCSNRKRMDFIKKLVVIMNNNFWLSKRKREKKMKRRLKNYDNKEE